MEFYDAHIHFIYQCSPDELPYIFGLLEKFGLTGIDLLVFADFPEEIGTALKMLPEDYHESFSPPVVKNLRDPLLILNRCSPLKILPFVDARFIEHDIEQKIKRLRQRGFKGLKLLYIPEEDTDLRVAGMEKAFGRTCKESEEVTSRLIESASSQGMEVLFHADLRKYGRFVEEMIRTYPQTNFNIPHFGYSRREISGLLDRYPNCYTDIASLTSFMEKDPVSYRGFIKRYQDRILLGSDSVIDQPEKIQSVLKFLERFVEDREVFYKLANKNYMAFHRIDTSVKQRISQ